MSNKLEEALEEISRLKRALAKKDRDNKILSRMKDYSENLNAFYEDEKKLQYLYNDLLLSNCPNMIFLFDENLHYVLASDACKQITDSEHKDLVNKPFDGVFSGRLDPLWVDKLHDQNGRVLETLASYHYDDVIPCRDGSAPMNAHVTISPIIDDDGACRGTIMAITDVSELIEAKQRVEESAAEKMRFFANMSHEIRTPMNAILGISELMLSEELDEKLEKYSTYIKKSSESLISLINDILDISKLESGNLSLVNVHYDFDILIENIWSISNFLALEKNLRFSVSMNSDIPGCLYGDDQRLRQILLNLINNAIKFTDRGDVTLALSASDDELRMEVRDTGIGIRQEDIPGLFQPFKQADGEKNRKIRGTGLGLSISKNLAEAMGGRIEVESRYGEGSAFTLVVPKIAGDRNMMEDKAESTMTFTAYDARVLIVDDNEVNLNVASGLIGLYGISCDTVQSGLECITALSLDDSYDLVFMDHMMPEMDGVEATRKIRAMGGRLAEIPIVALSANALMGMKELFISSGMDDFLSKPIERKKLAHMLIKWIPEEKVKITGFEPKRREAEAKPRVAELPAASDSISIDGVDTVAGITNTGGSFDGYVYILSVFHREGFEKTAQMDAALKSNNMKLYATHVHSMKSSSATIGASAAAKLAKELETAALAGDADFVESKHPIFAAELKRLLGLIGKALDGMKPSGTALPDADASDAAQPMDRLPGDIASELAAALDMLDVSKADEIMSGLASRAWTPRVSRALEEISRCILTFDYDEAKALINEL